jgi:hypothetical protein
MHARLLPDVQAQEVVAAKALGQGQQESAAAAAHIQHQRPLHIAVCCCPVRRRCRDLQLLLQGIDMLPAAHAVDLRRCKLQPWRLALSWDVPCTSCWKEGHLAMHGVFQG